jgi:hypothetical protein
MRSFADWIGQYSNLRPITYWAISIYLCFEGSRPWLLMEIECISRFDIWNDAMSAVSKGSLIASGLSTNLILRNSSLLSYHIIDSSSAISSRCGVCSLLPSTYYSIYNILANSRGIRGSFRKLTLSPSSSRSWCWSCPHIYWWKRTWGLSDNATLFSVELKLARRRLMHRI